MGVGPDRDGGEKPLKITGSLGQNLAVFLVFQDSDNPVCVCVCAGKVGEQDQNFTYSNTGPKHLMPLGAPANTFTGKSRIAHLQSQQKTCSWLAFPEAAFQHHVSGVSFALRGRSEHFRPLDAADAHRGSLRVHYCPESPREVPALGLRSL